MGNKAVYKNIIRKEFTISTNILSQLHPFARRVVENHAVAGRAVSVFLLHVRLEHDDMPCDSFPSNLFVQFSFSLPRLFESGLNGIKLPGWKSISSRRR